MRRCTPRPDYCCVVDGPADTARFNKVGSPAIDPQGNIWIPDQDERALRRISSDGQVTTVIPTGKICAASIKPEDQLGLRNLTWDAAHGELVGGRDFGVAVPVHNWYTTCGASSRMVSTWAF